MLKQGETHYRRNGRGKLKGRTVTQVSNTSVFWHKENGTRIHKTARGAFEYWLHHGRNMYKDQLKQKNLEDNYICVGSLNKSSRRLLRESGVRHKNDQKQVWIHKDDYEKAKQILDEDRQGTSPQDWRSLMGVG